MSALPAGREYYGVRVLQFRKQVFAGALAGAIFMCSPIAAGAETLMSALAHAYASNPTLNAARAEARAVDEKVSQALAGWRPTITGELYGGAEYSDTRATSGTRTTGSTTPGAVGVTINQPLFNGYRTVNATKQAEAAVRAAHESLRNTEQNVLLQAAQAFADVVRDTAIVDLRRNNVSVLKEQLGAVQDRFQVGEVTRTDVAQARARLSAAQSELNAAPGAIAHQQGDLYPDHRARAAQPETGRPVHAADPGDAGTGHFHQPQRTSRDQGGAFLRGIGNLRDPRGGRRAPADVLAPGQRLLLHRTVELGQHQLQRPDPRRSVGADLPGRRGILGGARGQADAHAEDARDRRCPSRGTGRRPFRLGRVAGGLMASIQSAQAQIEAAGIALKGVQEEARVGQRTTLDVLDAQQELLDARVSRVIAERDQVVASVSLYSALGRLQASRIGLKVREYQPEVNARQVRDKWFGLRTSDGQ